MPDLPNLKDGMSCRREVTSTLSIESIPLTVICHTLSTVWHKGIERDRFARYVAEGYLDDIPMSQYTTQSTDQFNLTQADWIILSDWMKGQL